MLVSMNYLLSVAQKNKFAIGAFNVADSCFVRAVLKKQKPVRHQQLFLFTLRNYHF
ncbi:hypothetical protein CEDIAZO_02126 [Celerinatantimonas diazotrophica]|nr:hypothetical protein CEDIAZO_02126 [Celerinatantimonas diazotrophica]